MKHTKPCSHIRTSVKGKKFRVNPHVQKSAVKRRNAAKRDLTYFAIMYGGVPMTPEGAKRYLAAAQLEGYSLEEAIQLVPNELRSEKYQERSSVRRSAVDQKKDFRDMAPEEFDEAMKDLKAWSEKNLPKSSSVKRRHNIKDDWAMMSVEERIDFVAGDDKKLAKQLRKEAQRRYSPRSVKGVCKKCGSVMRNDTCLCDY